MALVPTTELDAVNTMLSTIGEAPTNSLQGGSVDVGTARNILTSVSREVQSLGWHFNTEKDFRLLPDADTRQINLPANTLRVDTVGQDLLTDVVQRGTKLYDRLRHTYLFDAAITTDIVVFLAFDELPEAARRYITIRAARIFQESMVGSETLSAFTRRDEAIALAALKKAEAKTGDFNMLRGSRSVSRILDRSPVRSR
jgi:hypothetical protein